MASNLPLWALLLVSFLPACGREEAAAPQTIEDLGLSRFRACAVCHARTPPADADALRLPGPSLFGVFGAPSARLSGYDYSPAMRRAGLIWDDTTLDAYLADPQGVVPGTRMSYPGEPDAQVRAAIIAYLKTLQPPPQEPARD